MVLKYTFCDKIHLIKVLFKKLDAYFVLVVRAKEDEMSSDEDKPPAPPVRLTSNRATDRGDSVASVDMRPLPKG